jgi:hypothetical protein
MSFRDAASEIARWVLIATGLFLLLGGLSEFFSGFVPVGWLLVLGSVAIIVPALFSERGKTVGSEEKKWKVVVRSLFALVTLVGFSVAGWFGAAMMALTHEGDIPGSFHSRISPWDSGASFVIFLLIGIAGAARTLLMKRMAFLSWTLFLISAGILAVFAVQIAHLK